MVKKDLKFLFSLGMNKKKKKRREEKRFLEINSKQKFPPGGCPTERDGKVRTFVNYSLFDFIP